MGKRGENQLVSVFWWLLCLIILICIVGFLPIPAIEPLSRLLVPGIALMAAGIFPSMTLVVGSLRGWERSHQSIDNLHELLTRMLKVLTAAFVWSLLSILAIAITIAVVYANDAPYQTAILRAAVFVTTVLIMLLVSRIYVGIKIFFGLLNLEKEEAKRKATARTREFFKRVKDEPGLSADSYGDETRTMSRTGEKPKNG